MDEMGAKVSRRYSRKPRLCDSFAAKLINPHALSLVYFLPAIEWYVAISPTA